MNKTDAPYAIIGASGNIGSRIARELTSRGKKVRVIGRSADKLKPFVDKGAEAVVGHLDEPSTLVKAFDGTQAVFSMIPPNYGSSHFRNYQNTVSEAITKGIKSSGVKYVVNLSSVGAHLAEGTGPILGLHDHEERLNKIEGLNIVHLRPSFFMENLFSNIPTIKTMGLVGSPLKGTLSVPMIATKDIAAVATELLLDLHFSGINDRELLGSREVTMNEVTKIFSKALGRKDLNYMQFPYAEAEKAMEQMGLSPDVSKLLVEMYKSMNEGILKPAESRPPQNTTPTTIEDFAQVFAEICSGAEKVGAIQ